MTLVNTCKILFNGKVLSKLRHLILKRYEEDLLNEVLYPLVGQEATKILEVKVGGRQEIADSARFGTDAPRA